jgi:hypothetical protein
VSKAAGFEGFINRNLYPLLRAGGACYFDVKASFPPGEAISATF